MALLDLSQWVPDQSQIVSTQKAIQAIINNPGLAQKAVDNPILISTGLTTINIFSPPDPSAPKDYTGIILLGFGTLLIGVFLGWLVTRG